MQIEEERRGTQQLRQQLAEAQQSLHEESLKPKRTSAFGVRKLSAHNQSMP
jgi:hypothetical protein